MKQSEHLTKEQIAAYAARSPLAPPETDEIEIHLLQCAACRDLMPAPTPEQFWSALLDETEFDERFATEKSSPARSPLSPVFAFFRQPLAWGASALILVAGITFLIWLGVSKQSDTGGNEVVQTVETPKTASTSPTDENLPDGNESIQKNESAENSQPLPRPKQPNINLPAVKENSERMENRELAELLENTPPAVSSLRPNGQTTLRGGDEKKNSNAAPTFVLLTPVGETVLDDKPEFGWEKLDTARSYEISIFDKDFKVVLTANVSGNNFKPEKSLKPGAKYLWRVAAQTDEGEIIAPLPPQPPAVFRIAEKNTGSRINSLKKSGGDRFKLAVFYAQEGMLDSANCLLTEILIKTPNHNAARRLLAKVKQWQSENQPAVERCAEPPTVTKEDQ